MDNNLLINFDHMDTSELGCSLVDGSYTPSLSARSSDNYLISLCNFSSRI